MHTGHYEVGSPMWIILLNKGYVLMWIFREPPPPWSSTWFKDPPYKNEFWWQLIAKKPQKAAPKWEILAQKSGGCDNSDDSEENDYQDIWMR